MTLGIIDGVNILFRAYYGLGPMTSSGGTTTHALFGFIRSVQKMITERALQRVVVVFDGPGNKESRQALYEHYKSHRTKMPEDLLPQLELAQTWCTLMGIPWLAVPGVEADDTMGSMARWAAGLGHDVKIFSSDKDLCQLVTERIHVVHPGKDYLEIDAAQVKELFGVTPEQMVDYLALVGDTSDNIPGVRGCGPKTAASLLHEWGNLETIFASLDQVKGEKKQAMLRAGQESAELSRKLAVLQYDVPFPMEERFFLRTPPDLEKLKQFYRDQQFLSLLKDMGGERVSARKKSYSIISDEETLHRVCKELKQVVKVCVDVETTDIRPMWAELVGIGIGYGEVCYYIPCNGSMRRDHVLRAISEILQSTTLVGHNIKYDLHVLCNENLPQPRVVMDTIVASYLLRPQHPQHNLDHLVLDQFQVVKTPIEELIGKGRHQQSMLDVPIEQVGNYCCQDVDYTLRLEERFIAALKEQALDRVFYEIEIPLIPVLLRMERRGIYLDVAQMKQVADILRKELHRCESSIYDAVGEVFNINSPQQLSSILFDKLKIPPMKKTATGYSTNAQVLEELKDHHPVVEEIVTYRGLEKLRSTYLDPLPSQVHPKTGRVHATFQQFVTATGRLSCQHPNLQNIPVRSALGKQIRGMFKPQEPGWSFMSADYSQIELRLLAHLSDDPQLVHAFTEGQDVHAFTASLVFGIPLGEVTQEMRQRAKGVNFGVLYGQQAFGLSQGLGMSYQEAAHFIDAYFQRYPRVKDFIEFCKESVRKKGYAETLMGRKRPIPDILSRNPSVRSAAERLAINTPLQGTAADVIKMVMIEVDQWLADHKLGHLILQIHDELLFESQDHHLQALGAGVKQRMEHVVQLKVPLEVHIAIGKNWGEC